MTRSSKKSTGAKRRELADGKVVEAETYAIRAAIGDRDGPAIAASFDGAKAVIGVQTLESLGLKVNPITGEIEATRQKGIAYFYWEAKKEQPVLEPRVARIEGILEEMRSRLNHLESSFEHRMGRLEDRLQSNFRWTIAIILTMWVTIILAILLAG